MVAVCGDEGDGVAAMRQGLDVCGARERGGSPKSHGWVCRMHRGMVQIGVDPSPPKQTNELSVDEVPASAVLLYL